MSLAPPRSATGMVRNVIKKLLKIFLTGNVFGFHEINCKTEI